jgi:hypothetical protein
MTDMFQIAMSTKTMHAPTYRAASYAARVRPCRPASPDQEIGGYTFRTGYQSIWVGLGLSSITMAIAAGRGIPPNMGAFLQEVLEASVILNALIPVSMGEPASTTPIRHRIWTGRL